MNPVNLLNTQRIVLPTKEAAVLLNRKPQTLRAWACKDSGPLRPIRINGRLGWKVEELLKLMEVPV